MHPKITIVTPTYNSARFLERTIESVISQNYPNLEYMIIDGGSTDDTLDIIKQYEEHLAYWVSEPDNGMYDAIQKGFDRATGDIMCWLNSDDLYFGWTLEIVGEIFTQFEVVDWITSNQLMFIDENDLPRVSSQVPGYSQAGYFKGEHLNHPEQKFSIEFVMQEGTFWRRSLWDKTGASLDTRLKYAGDAELWFRFFGAAILYDVSLPLAMFRSHDRQITRTAMEKYKAEVQELFERYNASPHNKLSVLGRRFFRKYTPLKLRKLPYLLGLLHKSHRLQYSIVRDKWEIRQGYY